MTYFHLGNLVDEHGTPLGARPSETGSHPTGQAQGLGASRFDPARIDDLVADVIFLCARVRELDEVTPDKLDITREYYGHVIPALERTEAGIRALNAREQ